ncbi:MAG TPA: 8-amino-7-oxononanoate synthase [Pelomicrobium sp.]|nr:8-amino-7-oxononanoate synthase [Pelomicrobium sp.]
MPQEEAASPGGAGAFPALAALDAELRDAEARGLRRTRLELDAGHGAHPLIDGEQFTAFCSNDYLGLCEHPALAEAVAEGARRYGVGAGASHLVSGHGRVHAELERALAAFVERPAALLFSTGYMANLGVLTTLAGRGDAIFQDKLNHASLIDAALLARAELKRYPHGDLDALERLLRASSARTKVIATDAVFSMDGDMAPLAELLALAERHEAWLYVDDAHGFGVLGPRGAGSVAHFGLRSSRLVYLGTLGKAAGVCGAFVAGEPAVIDALVQRARTYIYTTALPPMIAHVLARSLELIAAADDARARLRAHIGRLRAQATRFPGQLLASATAIQPLVLGDNRGALTASQQLRERGFLVPAIRPPTVPQGTARLRISLSAAHTDDDVDALIAGLAALSGADAP